MSISGIIKDVKTSIYDDRRFGIAYNAVLKKKLYHEIESGNLRAGSRSL